MRWQLGLTKHVPFRTGCSEGWTQCINVQPTNLAIMFPSVSHEPRSPVENTDRDTALSHLNDVKAMSFSTNICSSKGSLMSLISPTAHWLRVENWMLWRARCCKLNNAGILIWYTLIALKKKQKKKTGCHWCSFCFFPCSIWPEWQTKMHLTVLFYSEVEHLTWRCGSPESGCNYPSSCCGFIMFYLQR